MIVITGASDGLGLALAKLYKKSGAKVINISRRECKYADQNINTDLQKESDIRNAASFILEWDEPLDILINCAGVLSLQDFNRMTSEEVQYVLAVNTSAPMLLVSNLINRIKQDSTDVVNIASTASFKGSAKTPIYNTSKWGLLGFSKSLKEELKDTSSRVISFCPDIFSSGLFEKATGENVQDRSKWMRADDLAVLLKQILDLPKIMEVSEIIIDRNKLN